MSFSVPSGIVKVSDGTTGVITLGDSTITKSSGSAFTFASGIMANNNSQDLGTSGTPWANIYGSTITVTNPLVNNTQSYGILRGATNQNITNSTLTELTTYYTGGTNISSGYIDIPSNGRLRALKAGIYLCCAQVMWNSGTGERSLWFSINSTGSQFGIQTFIATTGLKNSSNITAVINLALNDYVSCFVWQASGGLLGQTFAAGETETFSMVRVL
jgi:hypothetical protein